MVRCIGQHRQAIEIPPGRPAARSAGEVSPPPLGTVEAQSVDPSTVVVEERSMGWSPPAQMW